MSGFDDLLDGVVTSGTDHLSNAEWAERQFLNPTVPEAVTDDPDGTHHFNNMQVAGPDGEPIEGLSKGDEVPLYLRDYQKHSMDSGEKWRAHRWGRRCLVGGTPVLMADGSCKPIEDIEKGERVVCRDNRDRLVSKPVTLEHDNGVKDVYEIQLSNGRSVTCTANHPLLTLQNKNGKCREGAKRKKYRSIEEGLEKGDKVVCTQHTDRWDENQNWIYPTIKSITHKGKQQTYDIGVKDHNNFIADGIVNHNTGKTFQIGVEVVTEALRDPNAQVLILAPAQNQVKVIFDDYIRPLLRVYKHRSSSKVGIDEDPSRIGDTDDFVITKDRQKPQEIVIEGPDGHLSTIRGMVVSDSARGQSASFLVLDEADYADSEDLRQIVSPIMMTQPNTKLLMVSTPSGRADTYYRNRFNDDDWWTDHQDFTVLPHFSQELWDRMASQAGGEHTNTFKQEYLAQWGTATEGVFDQSALNKSFIISPYPRVMEETDRDSLQRSPTIAADRTHIADNKLSYYEGVRPMDHGLVGTKNPIGARSVYRPEYRGKGRITVGTDWNEVAGMQTVIIWWPPQEMIKRGDITVARYQYDGDSPTTTDRMKNKQGQPKEFVVGSDNGDPGGQHDLRNVEGIVIWHGRLESGNFNWQSAANRVCSIMAIPQFVDCWYVDKGYGRQVNSMIKQIWKTGQWQADMNILHEAKEVDQTALEHMRLFNPERDSEVTGKKYRPIDFGSPYEHRDVDLTKGQGKYKHVMINLARRMVTGRKLLFPHKEMVGFYQDDDLGEHYREDYDVEKQEKQKVAVPETDDDKLKENGVQPSQGQEQFGGLVTQMQTTKIEGYTPQGRPRYSGDWHAVDGLMLALLAYWENFAEEGPGNMFRHDPDMHAQTEEDIFNALEDATESTGQRTKQNGYMDGPVNMPSYKEGQGPLQDLIDGRKSAEEVGTSMHDMLDQVGNL